MSYAAVAFLAGFGIVMLVLVRWMGATNTDREGFVELVSFDRRPEAARALVILEEAKIPSFLEDHRYDHGKRTPGITRLLVKEDCVADATRVLREQASYVEDREPPA